MTTFRQGSPIIVGDRVVAYMAQTIEVPHDSFHWTWFTPTAAQQMPPQHSDGSLKNVGLLTVDYDRGGVQVLRAVLQGDQRDDAFLRPAFQREAQTPDQEAAQAWLTLERLGARDRMITSSLDNSALASRVVECLTEDTYNHTCSLARSIMRRGINQ